MTQRLLLSLTALALVGLATPPAHGQIRLSDGVSVRLSGLIHSQFNSTSVDGEPGTEFLIRRARLSAEIRFNEYLSAKVEPDFGEGKMTLKDAWVRLSFGPEFRATFGQFKRPFDLFELTSSTRILVVERAGGVRGVDTCTGTGGVCSLSRFTETLHYADRDIGIMLHGNLAAGRLSYAASVTNGTGANADDENGNKSFSGRVGFELTSDVVISANVGVHDYVHPTSGTDRFAMAFGGDVEIGNFTSGPHLQLGIVGGGNWRNPVGTLAAATFLTAQGILTYKIRVASPVVTAVEPVGRVSWGDPDTDVDDDAGLLFTPGLALHFGGRNSIAFNLDIWSPAQADTEYSFKAQSFFHF